MILENKNILLISPEPWDHIHVSKHHYAIALAKRGNKVYFMDPPSKVSLKKEEVEENIWRISYDGFLRGHRFLPALFQKYLIRRLILEMQKQLNVHVNVVWNFDNSVFYRFDALAEHVLTISHIVDLNQNFQFELAAKTSDLNIGVHEEIVEKQKRFSSKSYLIGHGISEELFDEKYVSQNVKLPGLNEFKALYFGNLDSVYIDWNTIGSLVKEFKEIDFIFIGPKKNEHIPASENLHYLKSMKTYELGAYMKNVNFLFSFYNYDKYGSQVSNPHKILEYLSSGKPVISNYFGETEYSKFLFHGRHLKHHLVNIKQIIEGSFDQNRLLEQVEYSKSCTYENRIRQIEDLISKNES